MMNACTLQVISSFLYKKKMFPSMQEHVHWVKLDEKTNYFKISKA